MSWDPITTPVDHILLAGQASPGLAEIVGAGSPRKWEERAGYGLSGARNIFRGVGCAKFSVKLRLYSAQDWANWYAWKPLVDKPPLGSRAKALDIWHPYLEALDIKSVGVEDVSQPEQTDNGEFTITIKFVEFRQLKAALSKPEASKATPADPIDTLTKQLSSQVQELAQ